MSSLLLVQTLLSHSIKKWSCPSAQADFKYDKHPFLKQNTFLFLLYKIKYRFGESVNNFTNIFSMYTVFSIKSNLGRVFKYSSQF